MNRKKLRISYSPTNKLKVHAFVVEFNVFIQLLQTKFSVHLRTSKCAPHSTRPAAPQMSTSHIAQLYCTKTAQLHM